ncbi:MAG: tRNA dihydrouridine synthase DusB [Candidatus Omnitrophica bacterium]|nr:tRNA dihydrouridine synthase DusB [Candidatus Omnitrophota bacterium]
MDTITRTDNSPIRQMIEAKAVLAPMAGITDVPFRMLARSFGCAFCFTEMIDVNGIIYNNRKTFKLIERVPADAPLGVQLVGQNEDKFAYVSNLLQRKGYRMIDINAGCPARKVIKAGKGAALLKSPEKIHSIVKRVVSEVDVPVTVKIRSGWDENTRNYLEVADAASSAGAKAICVHVRTREQMYKGKADHEVSRQIKSALDIPVFASGNIFNAESAGKVLSQTGCDGVFVARGALGRPWIFREINGSLTGGVIPRPPGFDQMKRVMIEHYRLCTEYLEPGRVHSRMYKHVSWYLKGYKNLDDIMKEYQKAGTLDGFMRLVERLRLDNGKYLKLGDK